jgi:hypothetical protein
MAPRRITRGRSIQRFLPLLVLAGCGDDLAPPPDAMIERATDVLAGPGGVAISRACAEQTTGPIGEYCVVWPDGVLSIAPVFAWRDQTGACIRLDEPACGATVTWFPCVPDPSL